MFSKFRKDYLTEQPKYLSND